MAAAIHKYPRNQNINYEEYRSHIEDPNTMYGLPQEVSYCCSCVISNQRPSSAVEFKHNADSKKATIAFDKNGKCDACIVNDEKKRINWDERRLELEELCARSRSTDGSYDCIVSGSGGKDSFYTSHRLRYEYGMHPLTVTWAPHIYTDWGWKNFQAWIHSGFDNYLMTPNGRVHRLLTRLAFENLLHPFQPFIFGQKSLAPKMAAKMGIPLVFYGENEAENGNPRLDSATATRDWKYFAQADPNDAYLGGVSLAELQAEFGLEANDLEAYLPANPVELELKGIEVHYFGYYEKWHPQGCFYYAVENGGFLPSPERTAGTFTKFSGIDDKVDDLHYYTTCIKFGIGRASYDASQEIRNQEIDRDEGIALMRRFDGEYPERFFDELMEYLSVPPDSYSKAAHNFEQPAMDREYFNHLCDRFRPPHLWKWEAGEWHLRHPIWEAGA